MFEELTSETHALNHSELKGEANSKTRCTQKNRNCRTVGSSSRCGGRGFTASNINRKDIARRHKLLPTPTFFMCALQPTSRRRSLFCTWRAYSSNSSSSGSLSDDYRQVLPSYPFHPFKLLKPRRLGPRAPYPASGDFKRAMPRRAAPGLVSTHARRGGHCQSCERLFWGERGVRPSKPPRCQPAVYARPGACLGRASTRAPLNTNINNNCTDALLWGLLSISE